MKKSNARQCGNVLRQIPAYEGLNSDQIPEVRPGGGMIAVGIDSHNFQLTEERNL